MSPFKAAIGGLVLFGLAVAVINTVFFNKPGTTPVFAVSSNTQPPSDMPNVIDVMLFSDMSHLRVGVEPRPEPSSLSVMDGQLDRLNAEILLQKSEPATPAAQKTPSFAFMAGLFALLMISFFGPALMRRPAFAALRNARR